jgi:ABC-type uncharacterized transport system substrate-binding protein
MFYDCSLLKEFSIIYPQENKAEKEKIVDEKENQIEKIKISDSNNQLSYIFFISLDNSNNLSFKNFFDLF